MVFLRQLLSFLCLLAAGWVFAGVTIEITVEPAMSFQARWKNVQGHWVKQGDKFVAKNVTLQIDELETGIELRDRHTKEYFESKKFPQATLKAAVAKGGKFSGILEVHGVKQKINGTYKEKNGLLEATFKATLSQFKIKEASYMGAGVQDEVTVTAVLPVK